MQTEIITALISSIIGGILVAIVNHIFTRKKTIAEIDKIKAETHKTNAEADKIRKEMMHALNEVGYYDPTEVSEKVIYDGTRGFQGYDIAAQFSQYSIQQGVLVIQDDEVGLALQKYVSDGMESEIIQKNLLVAGKRKFHISCELKAIEASFEVNIFMWDELEEEESVDDRIITVADSEWRKADLYFRARPDKNYLVRILVTRLSNIGSLQIRNLVVAERTS